MALGDDNTYGDMSALGTAPAADMTPAALGGLSSLPAAAPALGYTPMPEPEWVQSRGVGLNKFTMFPNLTAEGKALVESTPLQSGLGGEAVDQSYFAGNVPGGEYLGVNYETLPTYQLSSRFGKPVEDYLKLQPSYYLPQRVVNRSTGEVLYQGQDTQGIVGALDKLTQGGNPDEWAIEEKRGDQWTPTYEQKRPTDVLGETLKLAVPIALQFVPGFGQVLGTKLGLSGLGAKAAGIGLTSALGRTGAGLVTGENLGQALKAGAISGLGSAATAGLLGVTHADKLLGGGLSAAKGAALGAAPSAVPGEILVQAARNVAAPTLISGLASLGSTGVPSAQPTLQKLSDMYGPAAVDPNEILVSASRGAGGAGLSPVISGAAGLTQPVYRGPDVLPGEELINVSGQRIPPKAIDSALGAAAGLTQPVYRGPDVLPGEELINVSGQRIPPKSVDSALAAAAGSALAAGAPGEVIPEVVGQRIPPKRVDSALAAAAGSALPTTTPPTVPDEIVVTGTKDKPVLPPGALIPAAAIPLLANAAATPTTAAPKKVGTVGKVLAGLTALDALTSLFGGRGGAGGLGAGAGALGTRASLSPGFSARLPGARGIFSPASFAPRDMSGVDFTRYGYGPALSFFENVPRTIDEYKAALAASSAPRTPATDAGMVRPGSDLADYVRRMVPGATDEQIMAYLASQNAPAFAEGGMMAAKGGNASTASRAVKGPGTGRSDEIPALLSDGEYVIDAETVAMLGDGSSKAGAKRLDELRVKVRKHKGRNLAKGKFSANAKRPENYLSGGRV